MPMNKVVLVTGGSSGIGLETAKALQNRGCTVYTLSRHPFEAAGMSHLVADVTNIAQVERAVAELVRREGRLDILVNNAGFGISGGAEFTAPEAAQKQLQVNFLGCTNLCRVVLPVMRKQGSGRIVNLSSVAAAVPIPFQAMYSASKAAINAYTMAVANEVRPYGITLCAVMPGDIRTNFTAAREKEYMGDDVYGGRIRRSVEKMERDEENGMAPEKAGDYISKLALKKSVKPLYAIRADYKLIAVLAKLLPVRLLNWLVGKLYAS